MKCTLLLLFGCGSPPGSSRESPVRLLLHVVQDPCKRYATFWSKQGTEYESCSVVACRNLPLDLKLGLQASHLAIEAYIQGRCFYSTTIVWGAPFVFFVETPANAYLHGPDRSFESQVYRSISPVPASLSLAPWDLHHSVHLHYRDAPTLSGSSNSAAGTP
jgi:hypothetical protein